MIIMIFLILISSILFIYIILRLKKELTFFNNTFTADEIKGLLNNYKGFLFIIPNDMFTNNFYLFKKISIIFEHDSFSIVTLNLDNNEYDINWEIITALNAHSIPSIHYVNNKTEIREVFNFENIGNKSSSEIVNEIRKEVENFKKWSNSSDYYNKSNFGTSIS